MKNIFQLKHWPVKWRTQIMVVIQVSLAFAGFSLVLFWLGILSSQMKLQNVLVEEQKLVLADQQQSFLLQTSELEAQKTALLEQQNALDLQKAVFTVYEAYPQFLFWRLASTSSLSDNDIRNGNEAEKNLITAVEKISAIDEELADSIEVFMYDLEDFNGNVNSAIEAFRDDRERTGKNRVSSTQNNVISMTTMLEVVLMLSDEVVIAASDKVNASLTNLSSSISATNQISEDVVTSADKLAASIDLGAGEIEEMNLKVTYIVVVMTVISVIVGMLLSRSISFPILKLKKKIEEIDQQADLTVLADDSRHDEVGAIAASMNSMLGSFKNVVVDVRNGAREIAGEADKQAQSNLDSRQSLGTLNEEIESVAAAMNEMTATSNGINDITSNAAEEASQVEGLCRQSSSQVSNSSEHIVELNQRLVESTERLESLASRTDQIYAVVDVIQGVSEQTNLLALNAAIEAARAGDQGRGFAVVADEVRTLAQRTEQSSGEIKVMVEQFSKEVTQTVESVNYAMAAAGSSKELSESAQESITSLLSGMQDIRRMNDQISQSTQEQSEASGEMDSSIMKISSLVAIVADKAGEMSDAMQRLSERTSVLQNQSSHFKT